MAVNRIEEIENMSRDALVKKLKAIYGQEGAIEMFFVIEELMLETSEKMTDFKSSIDFSSDDGKDQFAIISNYMKNALMWTKNQNELRENIDESIMKEAKEKRLAAASGTLEHRLNKRDGKNER